MEIKVGDAVIDAHGNEGVVTSICKCSQCEERGFFEPQIKLSDGTCDNISITDKETGYSRWYRIGTTAFRDHVSIDNLHDIIECESRKIEISNKAIASALRMIFRMDARY